MVYNHGLFYVHKLLAEAFIPNPYRKTQVNHIDGNKLNYSLGNLEWVSPSENMKHAYSAGLTRGRYGIKNHDYSQSKSSVLRNINALCKNQGITICELEREVGIGNGTISRWGECSPMVDSLKKVAEYFGVTVDDLLSEQSTS